MPKSAIVVHAYLARHQYRDTTFPLDRCGMYRAEHADNNDEFFVFSETPLKSGDKIDLSGMHRVPLPHRDSFYYLPPQTKVLSAGFTAATAPVRAPKQERKGYQPDEGRSDIMDITRGMF
jgi:hypothetical protein